MPRKPEQQLWDRMRHNICRVTVRLERIENAASDGIPDVLALAAGAVTFCELKQVAAAPKRPTTRLIPSGKGLRTSQLNWHMEWARHGGRSIIVVGLGANRLFCVLGALADEINKATLSELAAMSVAEDWVGVENQLKGEK